MALKVEICGLEQARERIETFITELVERLLQLTTLSLSLFLLRDSTIDLAKERDFRLIGLDSSDHRNGEMLVERVVALATIADNRAARFASDLTRVDSKEPSVDELQRETDHVSRLFIGGNRCDNRNGCVERFIRLKLAVLSRKVDAESIANRSDRDEDFAVLLNGKDFRAVDD